MDFDPQVGHEQAGRRPALVLSDQKYNRRAGLMVLCPITSQFKSHPFILALPADLLSKPSYVLCDQVKSLDWTRREVRFIARAPTKIVEEVTTFAVGIVQGKN
jgi:mRNA interferase MazF